LDARGGKKRKIITEGGVTKRQKKGQRKRGRSSKQAPCREHPHGKIWLLHSKKLKVKGEGEGKVHQTTILILTIDRCGSVDPMAFSLPGQGPRGVPRKKEGVTAGLIQKRMHRNIRGHYGATADHRSGKKE